MGDSERFTDRLDAAPYSGMVADAYDVWLPPGVAFPDDAVYHRVIGDCGGTALELGTGNGRFLVPARSRGLDVEGVEQSADMIAHCERRAGEAGVSVVVHQGDIAALSLDGRYAAIVCPAGSFTLLADLEAADTALARVFEHLLPGGILAMGCHTVADLDGTRFSWRLRRTGTDPSTGVTYVAHEAIGADHATPDVQLVFSRVEQYDRDGLLVGTRLSRLRLRSWSPAAMAAALEAHGFADVEFLGDDTDWVVLARRS